MYNMRLNYCDVQYACQQCFSVQRARSVLSKMILKLLSELKVVTTGNSLGLTRVKMDVKAC